MSDLLSRLDAMNATKRRAAAIAEYEAACDDGEQYNWEIIAHALRKCLPNVRKIDPDHVDVTPAIESGPGFAPWFEGKRPNGKPGSGKDFSHVRAEFTFSDGRTIRAYASSFKGKPHNIAGAARAACDVWRYRALPDWQQWARPVPETIRACIPETGAEYDPAIASAETAQNRQAAPVVDHAAYIAARGVALLRFDYRARLAAVIAPASAGIDRRIERSNALAGFGQPGDKIEAARRTQPKRSRVAISPSQWKPRPSPSQWRFFRSHISEPMPKHERAPLAFNRHSELASRLLASAISEPMAAPAIAPVLCAILARPNHGPALRTGFAS